MMRKATKRNCMKRNVMKKSNSIGWKVSFIVLKRTLESGIGKNRFTINISRGMEKNRTNRKSK